MDGWTGLLDCLVQLPLTASTNHSRICLSFGAQAGTNSRNVTLENTGNNGTAEVFTAVSDLHKLYYHWTELNELYMLVPLLLGSLLLALSHKVFGKQPHMGFS